MEYLQLWFHLLWGVVCCAKKEAKLDFDHQVVNEFIAEVTAIFQTAIAESFKQYEWVSEDAAVHPLYLTIKVFENHGEDLKDRNSNVFKKVSTPIYENISGEKIASSIVQEVTTNINYNGIVLDSSNPLRDGIQVESIDAVPKEKNITLAIGFTSLVYYKKRKWQST
ncbi:hypothetical protein [Spiroplasma endosymbiont of Panorpa germanica]|uniref:hypothetical protein n=1 Tax=Spiroplasma endosymbiont of Panorpa germanica TaxID=3066314 RepID=UPI0030CE8AC1